MEGGVEGEVWVEGEEWVRGREGAESGGLGRKERMDGWWRWRVAGGVGGRRGGSRAVSAGAHAGNHLPDFSVTNRARVRR